MILVTLPGILLRDLFPRTNYGGGPCLVKIATSAKATVIDVIQEEFE